MLINVEHIVLLNLLDGCETYLPSTNLKSVFLGNIN